MLDYCHEVDNAYDYLTIKTYKRTDARTIGHLAKEILQVTKFLLQGGALITEILRTPMGGSCF